MRVIDVADRNGTLYRHRCVHKLMSAQSARRWLCLEMTKGIAGNGPRDQWVSRDGRGAALSGPGPGRAALEFSRRNAGKLARSPRPKSNSSGVVEAVMAAGTRIARCEIAHARAPPVEGNRGGNCRKAIWGFQASRLGSPVEKWRCRRCWSTVFASFVPATSPASTADGGAVNSSLRN
jgi:hypothetical protein